jgi:hypothetical protein
MTSIYWRHVISAEWLLTVHQRRGGYAIDLAVTEGTYNRSSSHGIEEVSCNSNVNDPEVGHTRKSDRISISLFRNYSTSRYNNIIALAF